MAHACATVQPSLLICDERRLERVPRGVRVIMSSALAGSDPPGTDDDAAAMCGAHEDDPAVILFTAGTTSFPKGAVLSHRALVANLQTLLVVSRKLPHQIGDDAPASVTLVGLPLFHIGAIQLILVPLMTGSQIVFLEGRFDPATVLEQMETRHVTMFSGVPTMMERLLSHPDIRRRNLVSLRTVVLGGSPVEQGLPDRIRDAFPGTTRGVGQTYGLTEAGGVVSTGVGAKIQEHPGSSGRLAPVVEARIENPDGHGNGRILIRSPAVMDGYWGLGDDQPVDAAGWLDTGDLGHLDDGQYLYITGRAKDVIIRGGENVYSVEVEAALFEHPDVADCAVIGVPHATLGEEVGAVVIPRDGRAIDEDELRGYVAERLARYNIPTRIWFRTGHLPRNPAGKVLKRQLRDELVGRVS
jgi:long-chain acyl-CoA synthetase